MALRAAEAQFDLLRIREARATLLQELIGDPNYLQQKLLEGAILAAIEICQGPDKYPGDAFVDLVQEIRPKVLPTPADNAAGALADVSKDLLRMDRYEKRALSRLRHAVRALDEYDRKGNQMSGSGSQGSIPKRGR